MPEIANDAQAYEIHRQAWVEGEIGTWAEGDIKAVRYSEYRRALDAITKAATAYAIGQGASIDDYNEPSFDDILRDATAVVSDLRFAVRADRGEDNTKLRLWSHRDRPIEAIKAATAPDLDRPEIEATVTRYLELPYRATEIDRTLVDLLVAMELFAYGQETIGGFSIPGVFSNSPLKRKPIIEWLVGNLLAGVFALVIGGLFWLISLIHLFPNDWLWGVGLILFVLTVLNFAWSTLWLPRTLWSVHKAKKLIVGLLGNMNGVYSELKSDGPISARHIEQRAQKTAEAGVVWPAPLFVMLDDINSRTGRF